jgi:hypothetical protein
MVSFPMITTSIMAFFVIGTVVGDTEKITEAIRTMLSLKGTSYPYSAEYYLALPPQPRVAGRTEERKFFAEKPNQLYSGQTTENQRLRVLIRDKTLLFDYSDDTNGRALCEGPVDLSGKFPERWLDDHDFFLNSYARFDADLIKVIRELLFGSTVTRHDEAEAVRTYKLSGSRLGDLQIVLRTNAVEISAIVPDAAPVKSRIIVRYIYRDGLSPWSAAALAELTAEFKKAGDQRIQRLKGEFTMFSALKQCFPGAGETQVISHLEAKQLAVRHGYLLPTSPQAKVVEAKGFSGQLHLKVEFGGKSYSIGQYPEISRVCDDESLALFVKGRRKLGDYTVLDISTPGSESNYIYYLKRKVALIVQDPQYRHIPFRDRNLDRLIQSFVP